jgi:hypothetical protein
MRLPRVRFTLLQLMITVAVIACILVLLETSRGFLLICILWSFVLAAIFRALFRGRRRRASLGFGIASATVNCSFAASSVYGLNTMWGMFVMFLGCLCGIPLILGSGTAWARAATRREAAPPRSPIVAWPLVIALAALPLTMVFIPWPLRVAFLASKPALIRLADRVADGRAPGRPIRAGLFMVVGSIIDSSTGNIGLIIDPDASGRSGFVRFGRGSDVAQGQRNGPFYNLDLDLDMYDGWAYQVED